MYGPLMLSSKVSEAYIQNAYNLCRRQVVLGGYRLANILKEIYSGKNVVVSDDPEQISQEVFQLVKNDHSIRVPKARIVSPQLKFEHS